MGVAMAAITPDRVPTVMCTSVVRSMIGAAAAESEDIAFLVDDVEVLCAPRGRSQRFYDFGSTRHARQIESIDIVHPGIDIEMVAVAPVLAVGNRFRRL